MARMEVFMGERKIVSSAVMTARIIVFYILFALLLGLILTPISQFVIPQINNIPAIVLIDIALMLISAYLNWTISINLAFSKKKIESSSIEPVKRNLFIFLMVMLILYTAINIINLSNQSTAINILSNIYDAGTVSLLSNIVVISIICEWIVNIAMWYVASKDIKKEVERED